MAGKKLRSRLFGFKKADVFSYICEMDEKAEAKLAEKDKEIEELKAQIEQLRSERESVVRVLRVAEEKAKDMVDNARKQAEEIREDAANYAREQKEIVNREIEIKRRAVKSYYMNENKKIDQIRGEVERMREASIEAIRKFELELRQVGRMTENSRSYVNTAMGYADTSSELEAFNDVERDIPVHIVESLND
ncbi:MAG: hypothetical protein E7401_05650 [Ruminococcaceae bacterium]|nr:hypothetical protein [Oscillospiraceae bacterium]